MSAMGFFSSRWSERHDGKVSEKPTSKTKWYHLGRTKTTVESSPVPSLPSATESSSPLASSSSSPTFSGSSTDAVTITLAQRLNELATANADGLLDDDEYRLLRQNIFERFGASSQLPSESSVIRMASVHSKGLSRVPSSSLRKADSNFNISRTASVRSNLSNSSSVTTTVNSLIRRATGRKVTTPIITHDASSIASGRPSSTYSLTPSRTLLHSISNTSLKNGTPFDARSISSRKTGRSAVTVNDGLSRTNSRSTKGPPSSYRRRNVIGSSSADSDGSEQRTVAQWREEIASVEAEGRRLLDAFNGLELSALTKHRPGPPSAKAQAILASRLGDVSDSTWTLVPDRQYSSMLYSDSAAHSLRLNRKGSFSSSLRHPPSPPPPLPPIPDTFHVRSLATNASQQIHSSPHLPLPRPPLPNPIAGGTTVDVSLLHDEDMDPDLVALQAEMSNIRSRRALVVDRYEKRLEFLRAKLKGAELRERILR